MVPLLRIAFVCDNPKPKTQIASINQKPKSKVYIENQSYIRNHKDLKWRLQNEKESHKVIFGIDNFNNLYFRVSGWTLNPDLFLNLVYSLKILFVHRFYIARPNSDAHFEIWPSRELRYGT